jgi:hypothetical protein
VTPGSTRGGWGWIAAALAVTIAAEVAWRMVDARLPTSDAGPLGAVADAYWALASGATAAREGVAILTQPGGWYAWLVAGALRGFGRTLGVFDGVSTGVWAAGLLVAGLLARRRGGGRAGAVAVLLVGAMPWLTFLARRHNAGVMEGVLAILLLYVVSGDRSLARARTGASVGVVGAVLLALGGNAWVWVATLLPALLWPGRWPRPWRLLAVLALWSAGATVGIVDLGTTIAPAPGAWDLEKLGVSFGRVRGLVDTPANIVLLVAACIWLVTTVRGVQAWSAARALRPPPAKPAPGAKKARPAPTPDTERAATVVLVVWTLAPLVLGVFLRPSPEAYPAAALALAVLAAGPLGRTLAGLGVAAVAWGLFTLPQGFQPPEGAARALLATDVGVRNVDVPYRPHTAWTARTLGALLDATCRSDGWASCRVVLDQGLAGPDSDDPGRLTRFLLAEERVALSSVYEASRARNDPRPMDAVLTWDCGVLDDRWRLRAPDAAEHLARLATSHDLTEVWSGRVDPACTAHWLAPRGKLAHPEALPAPDPSVAPWTARRALEASDAFLARHPSARSRQGRSWTARAGDTADTAPAAWSEEGAAWRRERARGD